MRQSSRPQRHDKMDISLQHSLDEQFEIYEFVGRDSTDGIVTHYGLDGLWIELRWKRDLQPLQVNPGVHLGSHTMSTGSFSGGYSGRGATLTTHCHITPSLKKDYIYTSTPLVPLWEVINWNLPQSLTFIASNQHIHKPWWLIKYCKQSAWNVL